MILVEIFAPPIIAKTGFFPDFKTLSIAKTSFSNNFPKNLLLLKNFDIIVVDACALCAAPKASLINTVPCFANFLAKSMSPLYSSL